ncbi:hypothetical protein [Spirochaeta isovalerica]|uniref:Outer membrane protein beta-barrel domain-containing protein n=1 Tax=Spirochaeta isovalerica TaxID=150 RepID=A0A841R9Z8_9SPIO|nr:hypothetical protein [Spirochaeta isovalerica]MBB6479272.1 hypothetical protein [Spirochaeta isovalerica]
MLKKLFSVTVLISAFLLPAAAQSLYLEDGIGGSAFGLSTTINGDGFKSAEVSAAYSIGGMMDIGFQLNRISGEILTYESTDWNFEFLYNLIVLKQGDYNPVNLQLEGLFGYSNITSVVYDNNSITEEGMGFQIGTTISHEFFKERLFSFLIGGKAHYKNYLYTKTDPNEVPTVSTERYESLAAGGLVAISLRPENFPIVTVETSIIYDITNDKLNVTPTLYLISPRY